MKLAFVNLELGAGHVGVTKAIAGQARAAQSEGLDIDFVLVNPGRDGVEGNIRFVQFPSPPFGARSANFMKARILAGVRALDGYDVVLLRYPTALDLDPLAFLRTTSARVITVHHTKEVSQTLSGRRTVGMVGRAAMEWVVGRCILSRVAGLVGVTDEIREYELRRAGRAGRSLAAHTIANGIEVESVQATRFVPFDGRELKLVFVASSHSPWHGTERLLRSLRGYSGSCRIRLDFVGGASGAEKGTEEHFGQSTIRHHGRLDGDRLDEVFRDATLAVSSLGLFRAGLAQACVLKTREYVARGIPFVYGYDDVDIPHDARFALRVANDTSDLPMAAIFAFAEAVSKSPDIANEMRVFAESKLDWRRKMRMFHSFARSIGEASN